jgi:hypothetical protein
MCSSSFSSISLRTEAPNTEPSLFSPKCPTWTVVNRAATSANASRITEKKSLLLKYSDPILGNHFMRICFASIEPMQFDKLKKSRYSELRFHFDPFGGGLNKGCNVVNIGDVMSVILPEFVLSALINWKLNSVKLLPVAKYVKT